MQGRIKNFRTYINEKYETKLDEGIISGIKSLLRPFSKVSKLVNSLISNLKSGRTISEGPKKGVPIYNYFEPGLNGKSVLEQVREAYAGIPSVIDESRYSEFGYSDLLSEDAKGLDKSYLSSDWEDVPNVNSEELKTLLKRKFNTLVKTGWSKPEFVYGAPGIGKTEIISQICDELGIALIPVELRFSMPVDLVGVPSRVNAPGSEWDSPGMTIANPPKMWPRTNWTKESLEKKKDELIKKGIEEIENKISEHDGPGGIIFFDEFNRADEFVANALMQFVQTRELAGTDYKLPSKWMIVAAGNRPKDDEKFVKSIEQLGSAMLDRFDFCNYVPTVEGFVKHVSNYEKDIFPGKKLRDIMMPEMLAFLQNLPENFYVPWDPEKHGYTTPRGWVDAAKAIEETVRQNMEETGKREISENQLRFILTRSVGKGPTEGFLEFWRIANEFTQEEIGSVFNDPEIAKQKTTKKLFSGRGSTQADPNKVWAWMATLVNFADRTLGGKIEVNQWENFIDYWTYLASQKMCEYGTACISMMTSKFVYLRTGDYMKKVRPFVSKCQEQAKELQSMIDLNAK